MSRAPIATGALAAAGARLAYAVLSRRPPGGRQLWTRANHRGDLVTLAEGPSLAAAAVAAALLAGARQAARQGRATERAGTAAAPRPAAGRPQLAARHHAAVAVAGAGAAVFGCYDDLAGGGDRRGFRGHLGALAGGELTSGTVKIAGIGLTGVAASALLGAAPPAGAAAADVVINAGLIAGSANLINLFDLRPGRAIKVALMAGLPLAAAGPAGLIATAPLAAAAALLPEDLRGQAMLGDGGANALGAMLGAAAAAILSRPARLAALAGIVSLTAASEVVSFTKIIEGSPALRWLDLLGRRPAAPRATPERTARPWPPGTAAAGWR